MRSRFTFEVEELRREARRIKLASYSRHYRRKRAEAKAPDPRDVQRKLWSLLSRGEGWDRLTKALIVELANDGYDAIQSRAVIDRMLGQC